MSQDPEEFELPVIDMREDPETYGEKVAEAFHANEGFALLRPTDDILKQYDAVLEAWDAFIDLDDETRRQYTAPAVGGEVGFNPMYTEQNRLEGEETSEDEGNPNRYYHIGRDPEEVPEDMQDLFPVTPYPDEVEDFEAVMQDGYDQLEDVAMELLEGLTTYAEEETGRKLPQSFADPARYGQSVLRLLDYPEQDDIEETDSRIGEHEDRGLITLLKTDGTGGLKVQVGDDPHDDDAWALVDNEPEELVINIGEAMSRLTNGFYPATRHGVAGTTPDRRRSIPFFVHASPDDVLETPAVFTNEEYGPLDEEWDDGGLDMASYGLENINKRRRDSFELPFLRPKEFHALNAAAREDGPEVYQETDED